MAALTTANGVESTKRAAVVAKTAGPEGFPNADAFASKLRTCFDTYAMAAADTAAAGFVLTIGAVPKGARVLGFIVANEANSAATTADLQLVDLDGNITAATAAEAWTSWNAANQQFIPVLEALTAAGPLDEEHTVTVTTAAQTWAASISVSVTTLYVTED